MAKNNVVGTQVWVSLLVCITEKHTRNGKKQTLFSEWKRLIENNNNIGSIARPTLYKYITWVREGWGNMRNHKGFLPKPPTPSLIQKALLEIEAEESKPHDI